MAIGDIIVGLDIGTSKVSAIVGEVNNFNQIEIISSTKCKCKGIQKGKIVDEDEISLSIVKAIQDAEEEANLKIHSAYVTVPGKYITIVQNSIIKEAKDKYAGISVKDVSASIMQIKDIEIPEGKAIIDIVTESFILDNGEEVQDPVGCLSSNFTIQAQIILVDKEYLKKMTAIFKKSGIELDGMVPTTLAERNLILDRNELNDKIMLLDIGAGNIEIGVFEGSKFIYTNTIPLGGDTIRKDIELVLGISEEEADKLKRQYGLALKSFIDNDHDIYLSTSQGENKKIKSSELIEIIEARIEEMFSLINRDIINAGIKPRINNVILTGQGITNINKSDVAGKIALNIPVKISTGRLVSTIKPSFRTSYALVRYVSSKPFSKSVASTIDVTSDENIFKTALEKIKEFFYS
ncbi:MAG: cell division protein FtsA [Clostridia bacterium]|nr:cell division protein FtsA [Clostridia bacterium]